MLELLFKIVLTILAFFFLVWLWASQVDVKATFLNPIKNFFSDKKSIINTRELDALYQNSLIVARISGTPQETLEDIMFPEIFDTTNLDQQQVIEYKRIRCKIVSFSGFTGSDTVTTIGSGIPKVIKRTGVLRNVICKKI